MEFNAILVSAVEMAKHPAIITLLLTQLRVKVVQKSSIPAWLDACGAYVRWDQPLGGII